MIKKFLQTKSICKCLYTLAIMPLIFGNFAFAESTSDVKQQIETNTNAQNVAKDEISTLDSQISTILSEISSLDDKIANNKKQISLAEAELIKQKNYLKEYIRTMYIDGQTSQVQLILTSTNFSDFVDKSQYLNTMQTNVQNSANKIEAAKNTLEEQKKQLEISQQQQLSLKVGLQQQRAQKDSYLAQLTTDEKSLRDKLAKMMTNGTISCGSRSKANGMKFALPLSCGFVSQGYGNTEYAKVDKAYGGAIHNGVDIAVGANTAIYPIGNGVVYATGTSPSGGWGNWIIINHQDGFYSLYAHMISPAFYSKGDTVTTDDTLGGVGGTPYWPVHLHLSLFKGAPTSWADGSVGPYPGNTVDPFNYMKITISTGGTDWDSAYTH